MNTAYNESFKDCTGKNNSDLENTLKYEIDGNIIIENSGIKTIIPRSDIYDGPDY